LAPAEVTSWLLRSESWRVVPMSIGLSMAMARALAAVACTL
jgi:hypothetical protein